MARLSKYLCVHGVQAKDVRVSVKAGSGMTWAWIELGDGIEMSLHADPEDGAERILEAIRDTAQAELDRMNAAPDPAQTDALTTETVQ